MPKIIEKEVGVTKLLQKQNGAVFIGGGGTQCSYLIFF